MQKPITHVATLKVIDKEAGYFTRMFSLLSCAEYLVLMFLSLCRKVQDETTFLRYSTLQNTNHLIAYDGRCTEAWLLVVVKITCLASLVLANLRKSF